MKNYSATKKNKIVSFKGKWMELEIVMLNEISKTEKDKYYTFSCVEYGPKIFLKETDHMNTKWVNCLGVGTSGRVK
jgi:hypothetical protein